VSQGFRGLVEGIDSSAVTPGHEMSIDLQSERGRVIAELLLHVNQRLANLDQQARERVPQRPGRP
jgi:hypothetical protein